MRRMRLPPAGASAPAAPNAPAMAAIPPKLSNSRRSMVFLPVPILSNGPSFLHEVRRQVATLFQVARQLRIGRREGAYLFGEFARRGVCPASAFQKRTQRARELPFQQRG